MYKEDINVTIENDNPSIRHIESMCIKCGKCREVCTDELSVCGSYNLEKTKGMPICVNCGQCRNVCPKHSMIEKKSWLTVNDIINKKNKHVIFMTSPAVRVAIGEEFGIESGTNCDKLMVGALKTLGGEYVFDVTFGADLTIMEEAAELIDRVTNNKTLPMFTSCCPAWVKFCEIYYPRLLPNISSCKSPISMQASIIKTYFAKLIKINPADICLVAVTPCTAKKAEILRPELSDASDFNNDSKLQDCDYVITTRELAEWIKAKNLDLNVINPKEFDSVFHTGSGAGLIFGNSGGVMEAALRTAYFMITGNNAPVKFLDFTPVRGLEDIKEANVVISGINLNVAVVHGLRNVRKFIAMLEENNKHYDFVEVMTCRGGCIGGGGQPKHPAPVNDALRNKRISGLYKADNESAIKCSNENPQIIKLYKEFLLKPLSEISEKLLHTCYFSKENMLGESAKNYELKNNFINSNITSEQVKLNTKLDANINSKVSNLDKNSIESEISYICPICGFIHKGDINLENNDYVCPICFAPKTVFEKVL